MTRERPTPPPSIRLVAVDLDGTLLDDSKEIRPRTFAALRAAASKGVKVVLASARPPRGVRPFYERLGIDTWQINYNGALIWDEPRRSPVFHHPMDGAFVLRMARVARAVAPEVLVSCEVIEVVDRGPDDGRGDDGGSTYGGNSDREHVDRWYTDRFDPDLTVETGRLFPPDVVAPLETFTGRPITKLMLLAHEEALGRVVSRIAADFGDRATVIHAEPELVQILARGGSKAAALERVAASYGIGMESILAVGDAVNDLEMLEAAGTSVAVANAHPGLKAVADWIAPSNNEDGVLAALVRFGVVPP